MMGLCGLSLQGTQPSPSVFIHNKKVLSSAGTHVKLHNYTPRKIDVTYTPQQVVTLKQDLTKIPVSRHTYSTGMQYIKCVTAPEKTKNDRKEIELLVRKEAPDTAISQLLDKQALNKSRDAVIRLYRKINPGAAAEIPSWKPMVTMPQNRYSEKLLENLKMAPDGKIHLENS